MQPGPETDQRTEFGELLKGHRAAARLTQDELAERAELSVRGLRYLERGLRRPYPDTVRRLVVALVLSPPDQATFIAAARPWSPSAGAGVGGIGVGVAPVPRGPLIGREREVGAAVDLLRRDDVRVVTLTGPAVIDGLDSCERRLHWS
jgi:transcriptional regulator with XRE-family HTH domain